MVILTFSHKSLTVARLVTTFPDMKD